MARRGNHGDEIDTEHQILSTTTIVVWAIGLIVLAGGCSAVLWTLLATGDPRDSVRLDTIRTAASIVVGTGGAAALLLAARKQRSTEIDLKQKDYDATERRVTELYGKAADQLGSDKAPVRLAGFYALERLAQSNPAHRQTIVNLICAYLRMPFHAPEFPDGAYPGKPNNQTADQAGELQELEVRLTAQYLLARHLRPGDDPDHLDSTYWPGIDLNLSGATLVKLVMTHGKIHSATFLGATFIGPTTFRGTGFAGTADFRNARFIGLADFRRVAFDQEGVTFKEAGFSGEVDFGINTEARLTGAVTSIDPNVRRKWPEGWTTRNIPDRPGWAELVAIRRPGK